MNHAQETPMLKATLVFPLFLVAIFFLACNRDPGKDGKDGKDSGKAGKDEKVQTPKALAVTAKTFAEEWKKDSAAAAAKYKDQTVELTGLAIAPVFYLKEDPRAFEMQGIEGDESSTIKCITQGPEPWWKKALPGQTVKIRGKCLFKTSFFPVEIVEVSGSPPQSVTVEELVKDPKGISEKKKGRFIIITGEIAKVELGKDVTLVTLKSPATSRPVVCESSPHEKHSELSSGQKIRVLTEYITTIDPSKIGAGMSVFMK